MTETLVDPTTEPILYVVRIRYGNGAWLHFADCETQDALEKEMQCVRLGTDCDEEQIWRTWPKGSELWKHNRPMGSLYD